MHCSPSPLTRSTQSFMNALFLCCAHRGWSIPFWRGVSSSCLPPIELIARACIGKAPKGEADITGTNRLSIEAAGPVVISTDWALGRSRRVKRTRRTLQANSQWSLN